MRAYCWVLFPEFLIQEIWVDGGLEFVFPSSSQVMLGLPQTTLCELTVNHFIFRTAPLGSRENAHYFPTLYLEKMRGKWQTWCVVYFIASCDYFSVIDGRHGFCRRKYLLTTCYTLVIRYIMNIKTTYCCPFKVLLVLLCVLGGVGEVV